MNTWTASKASGRAGALECSFGPFRTMHRAGIPGEQFGGAEIDKLDHAAMIKENVWGGSQILQIEITANGKRTYCLV